MSTPGSASAVDKKRLKLPSMPMPTWLKSKLRSSAHSSEFWSPWNMESSSIEERESSGDNPPEIRSRLRIRASAASEFQRDERLLDLVLEVRGFVDLSPITEAAEIEVSGRFDYDTGERRHILLTIRRPDLTERNAERVMSDLLKHLDKVDPKRYLVVEMETP